MFLLQFPTKVVLQLRKGSEGTPALAKDPLVARNIFFCNFAYTSFNDQPNGIMGSHKLLVSPGGWTYFDP